MLKNILTSTAAVVLTLGIGYHVTWAQNDSVRISSTKLDDHIFVFTSAAQYEANQVASVGGDGVLLVDAGWSETAPALREKLHKTAGGNVRILISTHGHGDHASGNRAFRGEAVILAHRNTNDQLSNRYFSLPSLNGPNVPEVLVDDSLTLWFNGETIRLTHIPECHSGGDLIVQFVGSNVVCVGDLLFPDYFPFIDLSIGGNVDNYFANIKRMIDAYPLETRFVAGHGRVYSRSDLITYYGELDKQRNAVQQAMAAGRPLDRIQEDSVLSAWLAWSGPWVTTDANYWIRMLHQSLSHGTVARRISISAPLTEALVRSGVAAAIAQYHSLKRSGEDAYDFGENELNLLGYHLLRRQMTVEAAAILKLNAESYPNSSNVYDSYGEALLAAGDTMQAIANYRRSLELNPDNTNAAQVLHALGNK